MMNFFDGQSSMQTYGFGLFTFPLLAIPPIVILRGLQIRGWTVAAFCLYVLAGCWVTIPASRPGLVWVVQHPVTWLPATCLALVQYAYIRKRRKNAESES